MKDMKEGVEAMVDEENMLQENMKNLRNLIQVGKLHTA